MRRSPGSGSSPAAPSQPVLAVAADSPLTVAGAAPVSHRTSLSHRKNHASTCRPTAPSSLGFISRQWEALMKIEGGCLCGKVRYSADTEPAFVGLCHCKNCQKATGTAFSLVVGLPKPALNVQGTVKTFTGRGDSGKETYRRFCPECGTGLIDEAEIMPDITMILAGTLDDTGWIKPSMEIFCDSAQPWVNLGGERQRFPKMPAR